MKKLLHPKVVILVSLLVISLTGIMQVVFADETIAKIKYGGKELEIEQSTAELSIGYHEFVGPIVEIEISEYQKDGVEFKLLKGDGTKVATIEKLEPGNTQSLDAYYTVEGNDKIQLYIKGSLINTTHGVYTIQAKNDESIEFKINIRVDNKQPVVNVYLNDKLIDNPNKIQEIYTTDTELKIEVQDDTFDPNETGSYNIEGQSSGLQWKYREATRTWDVIVNLDENIYQRLNITVKDKAGNSTTWPHSKPFSVDKNAPKITVEGVDSSEASKPVYTDSDELKISIKDLTLDIKNTKIEIDSKNYTIDETTLTCQPVTSNPSCTVESLEDDTLNITISDLQNKKYKDIKITSKDKAGRSAKFEINKLVVDTIAPLVSMKELNTPEAEDNGIKYYKENQTITFYIDEINLDKEKTQINLTYPSTLTEEEVEKLKKLNWNWNDEQNRHEATIKVEKDGYYEIKSIKVFDQAGKDGGLDFTAQPEKFVIDTHNPSIKVTDRDNNPYSSEVSKPVYTDSDELKISIKDLTLDIKNTEIEIDGEIYTIDETTLTCYSPASGSPCSVNQVADTLNVTISNLPDKEYEIKITSKDKVGYEAEKFEINQLVVDTKLPEVSMKDLNVPEAEDNGIKYYKENQTITFYINEINLDKEKTQIDLTYPSTLTEEEVAKLKKINWDEQNPNKATIKIEKDGYYEFNGIEVTDKAGNPRQLNLTQPEKFVIDTVKPIINVSDVEDEFYYKRDDEVTINVSIGETNFNPNLSTYTIYRKEILNSQERLYQSGNITSKTDFKLPTLTEAGEYRVVLTAKDMSGNPVEKDTELHFYIDHNDPKVSINPVTQNITNGSQINVSQVTLSLSATDDWKLANTTYTVKRNNEVINVPKQGEWEDFKLSFKDEGYYQVEIETSDEAGTKTVKETLEFTIDRTSPAQLSIVGNANHHNSPTSVTDGESYSTDSVNLQFTAQDEYSFNNITLDVTKNGVVYDSKTFDVKDLRKDFTTQLSKSKDYKLSQEGEYEVTFTVYDQAGNQSNQKLSFEIDRTSPVIDSNIEDGKYYNNDFLPEFSLDQPKRDEFTFINIDDVNYNGRIPVLVSDKVYTITALATDKAQNTTDYEATFTIDKTLPTIEINNLIAGFFKDTLSPSIFYSDKNLDSSKVSIKLNDVELGMGTRDGNGYTKAFEIDKDGTYTLEVSIGDLATNVSKQTVDFILDNEQPTIDIKNKITLSNQPWIPELEVLEDYGYDIVMVTLNGEEHDITQPIDQEGKNVLFIEVMDKSGNVSSLTLQFILDLTPPKVIIEDAATHELIKDGNTYLTNLDVKVYLDYVSQEGQEDTEKITNISLNGEIVPLDNVTKENGRTVYYLSVTEFQEYELEVIAEDEAGNTTVETVMFTLEDKDIVTKIYEKKPILYSLITVTGLSILGAGVYAVMVLKKKSDHETESSEEE